MSDTSPNTLLAQLSHKVSAFLSATGLTHKQLARMIGCERSQLTSYLSTGTGISAERALRLMTVLNSSRAQLERKFGRKAISSQMVSLQERGKPMKLDSSASWVPGQSGVDPSGSGDVTGVKTARDLPNADDYQQETIDFLKGQQNIYRSAIAEIDKYLAGIQRAKVNVTTSEPRTVPSNTTSKTPGPRGDLFDTPEKLKAQLEYVRGERKKTEELLHLQAELQKERAMYWAARVEAKRKELEAR
jgi:transcriptional regulator with XRE-family HTH domain